MCLLKVQHTAADSTSSTNQFTITLGRCVRQATKESLLERRIRADWPLEINRCGNCNGMHRQYGAG